MIIAKYKFNNTLADLLPEFNSDYTTYTYSDEVDGEVTTRTIECDTLPTLMRFGQVWINEATDANNADRCDSLLEVLEMNTSALTSMTSMFRLCERVTSIKCDWNTSNVTTMNGTFQYCGSLTLLDVSTLNTSNVTTMQGMFYNCNNLTSLDLSNFNTSNVDNMNAMFYQCYALTSLDVSNFNTNKVTNMQSMFASCNNLVSLNVSNFNTSKVANMYQMFSNCTKLTSLDVSNWDTSNVTAMHYIFHSCESLAILDVSNFNTSNVARMDNILINVPSSCNIGLIYADIDTVNKIGNQTTATLHVDANLDLNKYRGTAPIKPYRKTTKSYYLNSPLLEGDTIEEINGKVYHVHRWKKVLIDGGISDDWYFDDYRNVSTSESTSVINIILVEPCITSLESVAWSTGHVISRLKPCYRVDQNWYGESYFLEGIYTGSLWLGLGGKWTFNQIQEYLRINPITVVYELATPTYELISDESLAQESYVDGMLYTDSVIQVPQIDYKPLEVPLRYTPTQECTVQYENGDTKVAKQMTITNQSVTLDGEGDMVANVVVTENPEARPIDYFEGISSGFEDLGIEIQYSKDDYEIVRSYWDYETQKEGSNGYDLYKYIMRVSPDTTYRIDSHNTDYVRVVELDANKGFIKRLFPAQTSAFEHTFTTTSDTYYLDIRNDGIYDMEFELLSEKPTLTIKDSSAPSFGKSGRI